MSHRRVKLFVGAPDSKSLDWSQNALSNSILPAFQDANGSTSESDLYATKLDDSSITDIQANWRQVPFKQKYQVPFHTSHSDSKRSSNSKTSTTFNAHDVERDEDEEFLEHSVLLLEHLQTSQLTPHQPNNPLPCDTSTLLEVDNNTTISTFLTDTTILSSSESHHSPTIKPLIPPLSKIGLLTRLKSLPSTSHILSIRPQTITVNILIGIISISEPKTVHVRRGGGYDVAVTELIVGDETRAGFGISIWLPGPVPTLKNHHGPRNIGKNEKSEMIKEVQALRRGDVVLISGLALSCFRGKVFGQSLNRYASGVITRFIKMGREDVKELETKPGSRGREVRDRCEMVCDWVDNFVGRRGEDCDRVNKNGKRSADEMEKDDASNKVVKTSRESFLPPDSP